MKTTIPITPAMQSWNAAVAEFDLRTNYQFDTRDQLDIVLVAAMWPTCPAELALRLAALRPDKNETKN